MLRGRASPAVPLPLRGADCGFSCPWAYQCGGEFRTEVAEQRIRLLAEFGFHRGDCGVGEARELVAWLVEGEPGPAAWISPDGAVQGRAKQHGRLVAGNGGPQLSGGLAGGG